MKKRTVIELPGYVTVAVAADRLRLAPRSVRDLVYAGRMPSARLGRRHFLKVLDVEAERRRRLGLPLPEARTASRRRATSRRAELVAARAPVVRTRGADAVASEARRTRAQERAAELERWLRTKRAPETPALPFVAFDLSETAACDACRRTVRAGGRMVEAVEAESTARLCLTCARRTLLSWADGRRREALAARRLAQELGTTYTPLLESVGEAA